MMNTLFCFMIGCCIASFINVLVWRMPGHMNFVYGRSICPHCEHQLSWFDMIPIIAWLALRGRCRYCKATITPRYMVVEWMGGMLAVVSIWYGDSLLDACLLCCGSMLLLAIALLDWDTMYMDVRMLVILGAVVILTLPLHPELSVSDRLLGLVMIAAPMWLLTKIIADCFGNGDIILIGICGFWLGWKRILLAFLLAVMVGGCHAVYLLYRHKLSRKSHVPFGPYLVFGILTALYFGELWITWYVSLFSM